MKRHSSQDLGSSIILSEGAENEIIAYAIECRRRAAEIGSNDVAILLGLLGKAYGDPITAQSAEDLLRTPDELGFKRIEWKRLGLEFLRRILLELRNKICVSRNRSREFNKQVEQARKAIPAIAASITAWLGAKDPVSAGLATLAICLILECTHGAFCQMTDEKVLAEITQRIEQDGPANGSQPIRG